MIGISVDEWDDNIHRKSDEFIAWTDDAKDNEQIEQAIRYNSEPALHGRQGNAERSLVAPTTT